MSACRTRGSYLELPKTQASTVCISAHYFISLHILSVNGVHLVLCRIFLSFTADPAFTLCLISLLPCLFTWLSALLLSARFRVWSLGYFSQVPREVPMKGPPVFEKPACNRRIQSVYQGRSVNTKARGCRVWDLRFRALGTGVHARISHLLLRGPGPLW